MSTSSVRTNIFSRIPSHIRKFTFPLRPLKKTPAQGVFWRNWEPSNWQEDDYSSSTGYGILTERADLIVIDCDVKGDVDGLDSFLNLCYRNNYNPDKHTLSVRPPPPPAPHRRQVSAPAARRTSAAAPAWPRPGSRPVRRSALRCYR